MRTIALIVMLLVLTSGVLLLIFWDRLFAAIGDLSFVHRRLHPPGHDCSACQMERMRDALIACQTAIAEVLTPVLEKVAVVFNDFAKVLAPGRHRWPDDDDADLNRSSASSVAGSPLSARTDARPATPTNDAPDRIDPRT